MDWDRMMKNAARGESFTGQGASDEQAYFEAFSGGSARDLRKATSEVVGYWCAAAIGFVQTAFMLK